MHVCPTLSDFCVTIHLDPEVFGFKLEDNGIKNNRSKTELTQPSATVNDMIYIMYILIMLMITMTILNIGNITNQNKQKEIMLYYTT